MPSTIRSKQSIDDRLLNDKTALQNASTVTEIANLIAPFGYDTDKLNEGLSKHANVESLILKQLKEYGDQYAATEAVKNAKAAAHKAYSKSLKIARIVFEGDLSAQTALQLMGKRKTSLSGWLSQAGTFYSVILERADYIARTTPYSLTSETLTAEQQLVDTVKTNHETQLKEMGEAQAATNERDTAIDDFFSWMSTFYKFVKIALADHPQLREQLGILER